MEEILDCVFIFKEMLMSFISRRLSEIKPSPTLMLAQKAEDLKTQGRDIINLTVGEPDFQTPSHICEGARVAMLSGQTKYTAVAGTLALRKAISEKFKNDNNLKYDPNQILVSNGGKQVIFNAMMATINPGDEVIIPAPFWVSYADIVALFEGKPVIVSTSPKNNFKLLSEDLDKVITPKTKWLFLNSPSNPTGSIYSREDLQKLAKVLLKHPHVHILTDDMYEYLIYDNLEFTTIASVEPQLYDRTLTVNGVSKAYSMTGWRIGYAGGPKDLIKAMMTVQSQSTTNPCSIAQAAALCALEGSREFLKNWLTEFTERRNLVVQLLAKIPELKLIPPQGAFYAFTDCHGVINKTTPTGSKIESDSDFAAYLLEDQGVALVPGSSFGLGPYIRISFATNQTVLKDACERIQQAVLKLSD
jgi:aspartate aminotransferase